MVLIIYVNIDINVSEDPHTFFRNYLYDWNSLYLHCCGSTKDFPCASVPTNDFLYARSTFDTYGNQRRQLLTVIKDVPLATGNCCQQLPWILLNGRWLILWELYGVCASIVQYNHIIKMKAATLVYIINNYNNNNNIYTQDVIHTVCAYSCNVACIIFANL